MSPRPEQAPQQESSHEKLKHIENAEQINRRIEQLKAAGHEATKEQKEQLKWAREKLQKMETQPDAYEQLESKPAEQTDFKFTKRDKQAAYKVTLQRVQRHLPKAKKTFSKFIHQPVVEKVSDIAGKTVFRPSLTLGASIGAFLGSTGVYLFAKYYGFTLAGSEFIFFGLAGALLGLLGELSFYLVQKYILK